MIHLFRLIFLADLFICLITGMFSCGSYGHGSENFYDDAILNSKSIAKISP